MKLSVKQAETVRSVSFFALFIVDVLLSINLYFSLGESWWEKLILIIISSVLICVKVLTLLNGARARIQYNSLKGSSETIKRRKSQSLRKTIVAYILYAAIAVTTITASLGYTLTTVDRVNEIRTVATSNEKVETRKETIEMYKEDIAENKLTVAQLRLDLEKYDTSWVGQRNKINTQMQTITDKNIELQNKIIALNSEIESFKDADVTKAVSQKKTMYALLGDIFKIPEKIVMLVLLSLISVLIEMSLLYTSTPVEDDDEPVVNPPSNEGRVRLYEKKEPIEVADIETVVQTSAPEVLPKVVEKPKESISSVGRLKAKDSVVDAVGEEKPSVSLPSIIEEPIPEAEVFQEPPVEAPIRPAALKPFEKFVYSLFSNGDQPYLKDRDAAAKESGLTKVQAETIFKYLSTKKGPTGYPLIEFRKTAWYPNYTSEVILSLSKK